MLHIVYQHKWKFNLETSLMPRYSTNDHAVEKCFDTTPSPKLSPRWPQLQKCGSLGT